MTRKLKYEVKLTETEREYLETYLQAGEHSTRLLNRVRVLLLADRGEYGSSWIDRHIIEAVGVSGFTVYNLRKQFCEIGLEDTIQRKKYDVTNRKRKLDGDAEAKMIAMMMGDTPKGHARWTLSLIADQLVRLQIIDEEISREGVRLYLKKINLNHGIKNRG